MIDLYIIFGLQELAPVEAKPEELEQEEEVSPEQFHLAFNRPRAEVFAIDQTATNLLDATDEIKVSWFEHKVIQIFKKMISGIHRS